MTEQDIPKMTHDEMIDVLKGLVFGTFDRTTAKEREALDMAISALENKGAWIPVSEKLPEEECEVYCQLSDGSNAVLYVQDNWGQMEWVDGMMGTGTYDVVAWREKPEPYKKKRWVNDKDN